MNDFFAAIDHDKQKRIINAAFKEFAMHGYKKASTNRIVEEAGIGKGMLFYYFESKKKLFQFLIEYSICFFDKYFSRLDDPKYDDYIEKYRIASKIKLEAYVENPYIFDFLARLYLHEEESDIDDDVSNLMNEVTARRNKLLFDADETWDLSKFRADIPVEKLVKYVKWFMDGYLQEIMTHLSVQTLLSDIDITPYWDEFDDCLDDLKLLFYR